MANKWIMDDQKNLKRIFFETLYYVFLVGFWEVGAWFGNTPRFRDIWATANLPLMWFVCAFVFAIYGVANAARGQSALRVRTCLPVIGILITVFSTTTFIEAMKYPDQDRSMLIFVAVTVYFMPSVVLSICMFFAGGWMARRYLRST